MENFRMNRSTLNKYFRMLENLDITSKKELIIKLTESIGNKPKKMNR